MKKMFNMLFNVALIGVLPMAANAAGTYYNSNPYQRYGTNSYNSSGRSYASKYGQQQTMVSNNQTVTRTVTRTSSSKKAMKSESGKQGFVGGLGLSHEFASWTFDMNNAGSKLHYDNLMWNVLDGKLAYYFGDSTPMQINVGARYGIQFDESPMIDDDISNGGYLVTTWVDKSGTLLGYQTGHALSVGSSKSGTQMGFNLGFGLTDYFKWGRVKMTPSLGYRYFQHKLKTEKNYGVTMEIFESTDNHIYTTCVNSETGELQCDPFLLFYDVNHDYTITGRVIDSNGNISSLIQMPADGVIGELAGVSTGGTYYYQQPGTSHEYTTTWAGPYLALDMDYEIDSKNAITGSIELGLPTYKSEGNQPYRPDWQHPKSVEDTGKFGDAMHFGLAAMWKTAVADATMLTLGFTYDYYKVSNAAAKTFLNSNYYMDLYDYYQNELDTNTSLTEDQIAYINGEIANISDYRAAGWVLESSSEIDSIYKSMGIRLGLEMKF